MSVLKKIFDRQEKVNETIQGKEWYKNGNGWDTAIIVEAAEYIDSFDWKWWKNGKNNADNALIECVDIVHFVASLVIEKSKLMNSFNLDGVLEISESSIEAADSFCDGVSIDKTTAIQNAKELIRRTIKISDLGNEIDAINLIMAAFALANPVGKTMEDVAKLYFGKAVLNEFRNKNGYTDGTYVKTWNGKEDNEVMVEIASELPLDDNFEEKLFTLLEERYIIAKD
jgi:dimeric dUTPase (all-alpha-NTP-PPase superfamily)